MGIFRKSQAAAEMWKPHVLAQLKEAHCWICEQDASEIDRDFFWFVHEQYYEGEMVDKMRLAHGFCPTHTRYFLRNGGNSVVTAVFSYLSWYLIDRLHAAREDLSQRRSRRNSREICRKAAAALRPKGVCPMCSSLRTGENINLHAFIHTLALSDVRVAYENSVGLCLPHFRHAALDATWDTVSLLTTDMQRRLKAKLVPEKSPVALIEQAVGFDKERLLRPNGNTETPLKQNNVKIGAAPPYTELGNPAPNWSPTFEQVLASLSEPGCPVCRACEQGVRQYLDWLAQQVEAMQSTSGSWEASLNVCPSHLWELKASGHEQAAVLLGNHTVQQWLWKLDRLSTELGKRPSERLLQRLREGFLVWCGAYDPALCQDSDRPRSRWKKVAAVMEPPQHRLDGLRAIAFRDDLCQACSHIQTTTRRVLDLILRVLEDSYGRKAYHESAGVCLRHCVAGANLAEVPEALDEVLAAQIARLRVIEWELEESARKTSWSVRYESKGPEDDAWRRAASQLYGI
jgi:hypothetical protein